MCVRKNPSSGSKVNYSREILSGVPVTASVTLRHPCAADATAIESLIAASPPLDTNSTYCTLLQCTQFAATCVVAEREGTVAGWISAHVPPSDPQSIFVWQVAVASAARGIGLGGRMLDALVGRPALDGIGRVRTTITEANQASWQLFESFARRHGHVASRAVLFDHDDHFAGRHDTEFELLIALDGSDRDASQRKEKS